MLTIFIITSNALLWGIATTSGLVLLSIALGRYYMRYISARDLTNKYQGKKWASPLEARNKYPEVDIFRYSSIIFRLGLVLSLTMIVLAMNWTNVEEKVFVPDNALDMEYDLEVEVPRSAEPPPPPPPPPPPVFEAVPDDVVLEEEPMDFRDNSLDENSAVSQQPAQENNRPLPPPPPPPPPAEPEMAEIFKVVEEMPRFPGCEDLLTITERKTCSEQKLLAFIYANISYPAMARENGVEGTVVLRFVVNEKGFIDNAEVVRDIGAGCGDESLRVIKLMNNMEARWIPGRQRGRPVKVYYTLPVKFVLKPNS